MVKISLFERRISIARKLKIEIVIEKKKKKEREKEHARVMKFIIVLFAMDFARENLRTKGRGGRTR